MPEKPIPENHHVVRHCPRNRTIRQDGKIVGVIPRLFELRTHRNEQYLSACYFEYFDGDVGTRMRNCLDATPREIDDRDCMVLMNVGRTKAIAKENNHAVRILHETAHPSNPAYARIRGVPFDPSSAILTILADEAADKIFPVSHIRSAAGS